MSKFIQPDSNSESLQENCRVVPFENIYNCRDLGGYETEDGRTVKWQTVYRSDSLSRIAGSDLDVLRGLGLKTVIDFRSEFEKDIDSYTLPSELGIRQVDISMGGQEVQRLIDSFVSGEVAGLNLPELQPMLNRNYVKLHTARFKVFMQYLLKADVLPLLFHSTGGKGRTGFATAILLHTLGVPMGSILHDYMLTNTAHNSYLTNRLNLIASMQGEKLAEELKHFILARQDALMAAFDTINYEYGSFNGYVKNGLGLNKGDVDLLKEKFLTK